MRVRISRIRVFSALLSAAVGAAFLTGCASAPPVTSWTNPATGVRTDLMEENLLDVPGETETREMLWVSAFREVYSPQRQRYHIVVTYGAREDAGPLEINPGRSLIVIADGQELSFSGLGTLKQEERKGAIFESARYDATADDIARIAGAQKVTVRVIGRNGIVVRDFAEENLENFRKFAQQTGADLQ